MLSSDATHDCRIDDNYLTCAEQIANLLEWPVERVQTALEVIARSGRLRVAMMPDTPIGIWAEPYPSPVMDGEAN